MRGITRPHSVPSMSNILHTRRTRASGPSQMMKAKPNIMNHVNMPRMTQFLHLKCWKKHTRGNTSCVFTLKTKFTFMSASLAIFT